MEENPTMMPRLYRESASGGERLNGETGKQFQADFFAGLASNPANAAVLMHFRVLFAFLGAYATGDRTGLELCAHKLRVALCLPCQDAGGGLADIGAVQIYGYASCQRPHLLLAQAGICTGSAGFGALKAGIDAAGENRRFH
jgi:hypothetical protein